MHQYPDIFITSRSA